MRWTGGPVIALRRVGVPVYSSLDRIDIVSRDGRTGQKIFRQTEHRSPQEIRREEELSILFALARVLNPMSMREEGQPPPSVRYMVTETPPESLQEAVAAAGGQLEVNAQPLPYAGPPVDVSDLADRTFSALAQRVLDREGWVKGEEALVQLETEILAQVPDKEEDETTFWTSALEISALAGELLRDVTHGRWVMDPHRMSVIPFAFEGPDGVIFNVAGKVERFLAHGDRYSVRHLLRVAEERQHAGPATGPIMVSFKPCTWEGRDETVCRALLDTETEDAPRPARAGVWTRYRDVLPDADPGPAFLQRPGGTARGGGTEPGGVAVEIFELDVDGLDVLVVTGGYYAAEKILDVAFMRQMHERLGSHLLAAGIPRKGVLMLTRATAPAHLMWLFCTWWPPSTRTSGPRSPWRARPCW